MAHLRIYVADALHREVRRKKLPVARLFRDAVRAELRRRDLELEAAHYLATMEPTVRAPTAEEVAKADALSARIAARRRGRD